MSTTLVISPHLDDAILSIGGSIAAWAADGPVVIATVYSAGPPLETVLPAMRKFADYDTRCREDAAACAVVAAAPRWLGHVEHAFRGRMLTMADIFTTPATRDGFAERAAIVASLDRLGLGLGLGEPDRVAIPLGIGNHVDHVEAVVAATDWAAAHELVDRTVFYEDFYALSDPMRRAHWLAARRRWHTADAPLRDAPALATMLDSIAAVRHGPPIETYLAPVWRGETWTCTPSPIPAHEDTKLAAIACYATQTAAFGGMDGIATAARAYHRWQGGAEPLWQV